MSNVNDFSEAKHIGVLNYNANPVCVLIAPNQGVAIDAAIDDVPNVMPMTFDQIKFANNTSVFKDGILEFEEDYKDDVYKRLGINQEDILTLNNIREILMNPTKDGLKRILNIKTSANFDRVRYQFLRLRNEGFSLTLDVANMIEARGQELLNGKVFSDIKIADAEPKQQDDMLAIIQKLQAKVEALEQERDTQVVNKNENNHQTIPDVTNKEENKSASVKEKTTSKTGTKSTSKSTKK